MPNTKIEFNHNKIARIQGLDEYAKVLFPGNRNHQRIFLAVFIELKFAHREFLPCLTPLLWQVHVHSPDAGNSAEQNARMGIIDHVSRFSKAYGYREGWVFSNRFSKTLIRLSELFKDFRHLSNFNLEKVYILIALVFCFSFECYPYLLSYLYILHAVIKHRRSKITW